MNITDNGQRTLDDKHQNYTQKLLLQLNWHVHHPTVRSLVHEIINSNSFFDTSIFLLKKKRERERNQSSVGKIDNKTQLVDSAG